MVLVLLPEGAPATRLLRNLSLADALALLGGFMFAVTNVTLRRLHTVPGPARMFSMFGGCMLMALAVACVGLQLGVVEAFPAPNATWVLTGLLLAGVLMLGNWALQFGAARLAAGTTALVMLSEVMFASVSSALLGAATLTPRTVLGGALISPRMGVQALHPELFSMGALLVAVVAAVILLVVVNVVRGSSSR